jgi:hypothetical protein
MNEDSKKRILARRAKFMMAAIAASGVACAKIDDDPRPTTDAATDTRPNACLSADAEPCLGVAYDAGSDTEPMPCLEPPIDDTGLVDDAEPMPCLSPPPDEP